MQLAWNTINLISLEYRYMWDKIDKLELLLYQQQNIISQLLAATIECDENQILFNDESGDLQKIIDSFGINCNLNNQSFHEERLEADQDQQRSKQEQLSRVKELFSEDATNDTIEEDNLDLINGTDQSLAQDILGKDNDHLKANINIDSIPSSDVNIIQDHFNFKADNQKEFLCKEKKNKSDQGSKNQESDHQTRSIQSSEKEIIDSSDFYDHRRLSIFDKSKSLEKYSLISEDQNDCGDSAIIKSELKPKENDERRPTLMKESTIFVESFEQNDPVDHPEDEKSEDPISTIKSETISIDSNQNDQKREVKVSDEEIKVGTISIGKSIESIEVPKEINNNSNIISSIKNSVFQGYQTVLNKSIFRKDSNENSPTKISSSSSSPKQTPSLMITENNIRKSIKSIFGGFKQSPQPIMIAKQTFPNRFQFSLPEIEDPSMINQSFEKQIDSQSQQTTRSNHSDLKQTNEKIEKFINRTKSMQEANTMIDSFLMYNQHQQRNNPMEEHTILEFSPIEEKDKGLRNEDDIVGEKIDLEENAAVMESSPQQEVTKIETVEINEDAEIGGLDRSKIITENFFETKTDENEIVVTSKHLLQTDSIEQAQQKRSVSFDDNEPIKSGLESVDSIDSTDSANQTNRSRKKSRTKWIAAVVIKLIFSLFFITIETKHTIDVCLCFLC